MVNGLGVSHWGQRGAFRQLCANIVGMKGSIERRQPGRYRLSVMVDGVRHRRTISAPTKTAARAELAKFIAEVAVVPRDGWEVTVGQLLAVHARQATWAATTRTLWAHLTSHLPAWFTELTVAAVRPTTVQKLYDELAGVTTEHQVHRLHAFLSAAWKRAMRLEWIAGSPFTVVHPPTPQRRPIDPPSPAVVRVVLGSVLEQWQRVALTLSITTGARRGEILGLRWSDVDLEACELSIVRSIAYTPKSGIIVKSVKTGSKGERTISLDPLRAELLRQYHLEHVELCRRLDLNPDVDMWLFPAAADPRLPNMPDNLTQAWERACKRAKVSGVRLHDLRHFSATQLLGAGVDVRTVAGRLGHADASTTLKRYAAFMKARDQESAAILGGLLEQPTVAEPVAPAGEQAA